MKTTHIDITREQLVDAIMRAAQDEWHKDVIDATYDSPHAQESLEIIDGYIRLLEDEVRGDQVTRRRGIQWGWEQKYDGSFSWGGAAIAAVLVAVGFHPELAKAYFPTSCYLSAYARYNSRNFSKTQVIVTEAVACQYPILHNKSGTWEIKDLHEACGSIRDVQTLQFSSTLADLTSYPEPGDLLLVGGRVPSQRAWGSQISLVVDCAHIKPATLADIPVFEGNSYGLGPRRTRREGLVLTCRRLGGHDETNTAQSVVKEIIRWSILDFIPELEYV